VANKHHCTGKNGHHHQRKHLLSPIIFMSIFCTTAPTLMPAMAPAAAAEEELFAPVD
jgi:hypothetical protein